MNRCGVVQNVSRPKIRCHETSHPEPKPRDPLELAAIHGLGRGHEGSRASRLHFDEHVTGAIAAHEVDLSESRASVARDDGHSAARELCLGHALAGHAKHDARMHSSKERMWLARPLLWGRCDADDPIRTVVRAEVERSV